VIRFEGTHAHKVRLKGLLRRLLWAQTTIAEGRSKAPDIVFGALLGLLLVAGVVAGVSLFQLDLPRGGGMVALVLVGLVVGLLPPVLVLSLKHNRLVAAEKVAAETMAAIVRQYPEAVQAWGGADRAGQPRNGAGADPQPRLNDRAHSCDRHFSLYACFKGPQQPCCRTIAHGHLELAARDPGDPKPLLRSKCQPLRPALQVTLSRAGTDTLDPVCVNPVDPGPGHPHVGSHAGAGGSWR
jgi:hypothetical protein